MGIKNYNMVIDNVCYYNYMILYICSFYYLFFLSLYI